MSLLCYVILCSPFDVSVILFVFLLCVFFFFKQKTAYEISACLVGSEMCIRDRVKQDPAEIDRRFADFDQCRLNDKQKEAVYYNAFYYYVACSDIAKVRLYGNRLLNLATCSEALKAETQKYYAVMIDHSYADLDEDLARLDQLEGEEKAKAEFLISKMFENQGDSQQAKLYLDRSLEHLHS